MKKNNISIKRIGILLIPLIICFFVIYSFIFYVFWNIEKKTHKVECASCIGDPFPVPMDKMEENAKK